MHCNHPNENSTYACQPKGLEAQACRRSTGTQRGKHRKRKPAKNVPLSMSTASAAARRAATRKLFFLPLFPSPLRRGRGLRELTQVLPGHARNRLLHRLLSLLLSLLLPPLLLFLPRPPQLLHLIWRQESHFQEEVEPRNRPWLLTPAARTTPQEAPAASLPCPSSVPVGRCTSRQPPPCRSCGGRLRTGPFSAAHVATTSAGVALFSATRSRGRHAASCRPPGSTTW